MYLQNDFVNVILIIMTNLLNRLANDIKRIEEVLFMAQLGEVFVCPLCGNEVTVTKAGGNPEVHCCGQAMKKKEQ